MKQKELIDRTHQIADRLEKEAQDRCNKQIEEAKAYCEGYIQGIEDYIRIIKADIYSEKFSD